MCSYLSPRSLARSRHKLKPLYLHNHSVYGHQTWQGCDLPWGAPNNKVTLWLCGKQCQYISTTKAPVATKLGKVVTYLNWLLHIKSHASLITCFCKVTWQEKTIIISTTRVPIPTKRGRTITYLDVVRHITWSCKITW